MSGVNVVDTPLWPDDIFDTAHVPMGHCNFYDGDIYWLKLFLLFVLLLFHFSESRRKILCWCAILYFIGHRFKVVKQCLFMEFNNKWIKKQLLNITYFIDFIFKWLVNSKVTRPARWRVISWYCIGVWKKHTHTHTQILTHVFSLLFTIRPCSLIYTRHCSFVNSLHY